MVLEFPNCVIVRKGMIVIAVLYVATLAISAARRKINNIFVIINPK